MELIGLDRIREVVDHDAVYVAVRNGLVALSAGQVAAPNDILMEVAPAGVVHVKAAHVTGRRWAVCKLWTGGFAGSSHSGCSFLVDAGTGRTAAVLDDGGWLTDMRTSAAGALATELLANPGDLTVAVLGTGVQARLQIEALRARRVMTDLRIWGRRPERAESLAASHGGRACPGVTEAVAGADVVITCTSAYSPFLSIGQLAPGTHVTALGSDNVGKRELDIGFGDAVDVLVADDAVNCSRSGELRFLPRAVRERAISFADLAAGVVPGRTSQHQITVADLCGIGTYDAAIAGLVATALIDEPGGPTSEV